MNHRGAYQKKQQNIGNIRARYEWLVLALKDLGQVPTTLTQYLSSQRRFADMNVEGTPIRPIALNTLRSIADAVLSGEAPDGKGFCQLDVLRQALHKKTAQAIPVRSVESQQARRNALLEETRKALRLTELGNFQRSQSYVDLFSRMVSFLQSASLEDTTRLRLHNVLQDHRDLHASLLSPRVKDATNADLRVIPGGKT